MLGIGGLVGDIVSRMIGSVDGNGNDGLLEVGGENGDLGRGRGGEKDIKFALSGCHDTTLAAVLASFGAFEGERWPPYTSHIALELFRKTDRTSGETVEGRTSLDEENRVKAADGQKRGFWSTIFSSTKENADGRNPAPRGMARKTMDELSSREKDKLEEYYVRLRYNDRPMVIPGCRLQGNHLDGNESFCTLVCLEITNALTSTNLA